MDYDSDISTKVVRVNRTYNVYRGTSPSTQNRLEVSAVCPPLSPAVDYCHLCFCKRKPIVFWKQHLFAAFLNLHLPLFNKSFFCELLCIFIFMLIARICIRHRTSKIFR